MTRLVAVLRPEPGNAATIARAKARGLATVSLPLFKVRSLAWRPVDPAAHDGLLVTSANAVRHAGAGLVALRELPVLAVGAATAAAAIAAGFDVKASGADDAAAIFATADALGFARLLHLSGRDRSIGEARSIAATIPVYASDPLPVSDAALKCLRDTVTLLHSPRAARQLVALLAGAKLPLREISIATLSAAVLVAADNGWAAIGVATAPTDDALLDAAEALFD